MLLRTYKYLLEFQTLTVFHVFMHILPSRHLYMQHLAVVIWKFEPDPNAGKKG